jgi:hypothetical protein
MTNMPVKPRRETGAAEYSEDYLVRKRQSCLRKIIRIDVCLAPQHDELKQPEDGLQALRWEVRLATEGNMQGMMRRIHLARARVH